MTVAVGCRTFTGANQEWFAALSGDSNPMHMDAQYARRTQAGAPVVHGVHSLLWLLDTVAAEHPGLPRIGSLKVRFDKMIYVGDTAKVVVGHADVASVRADVQVDGATAMRVMIGFEAPRPVPQSEAGPLYAPDRPIERTFENLPHCAGLVAFATRTEEAARAFPAAAQLCGARAISALLASTRLVGMVCPGLHSIFGGLVLHATEHDDGAEALSFRVTRCDERFRGVRMQIAAGGMAGTVESFARMPPVRQRSLGDLAGLVSPREFAGVSALIIGGSRGLGDVTAKLLAAGGAMVTVSYASGRDEAQALVAELQASGADAQAIAYDVRLPAEAQLAPLRGAPDQLYYMATPHIFRRKSALFESAKFAEFSAFYITGFWNAFSALCARRAHVTAFYPSSVAISECPTDMTEYAMAKAAGELMCAAINNHLAPSRVVVRRLPRILTDQTATIHAVETVAPEAAMLPVIRQMQHHGA